MLIATRVLKLRNTNVEIEIPTRIFAPQPQAVDWSCKTGIDWPDGTVTMDAIGIDAVQALELGLKLIGAQLYASDHHASGRLIWQEPGKGYDFPVVNSLRDMLIGDDKTFT
ncbi:DUF6968 family protein [Pseudorhodoplanes sp.]|uniref:DUF6968 family protein n=1 Tax=Pseudorhodoplanes sp. TaxID=1934341 RepID=UPI00391C89CE